MALVVRNAPIGASTKADMNLPTNALAAPSLASFSPLISTTQYSTKNSTEMMAGVPRPPFRISAPKGAPMKNSSRQARACAYFLHISTSVRRRILVYSKASYPWLCSADSACEARFAAFSRACF